MLVATASLPAHGAVSYRFVDLGPLGGQRADIRDINNAGQIVGESTVGQTSNPYAATIWGEDGVPRRVDERSGSAVAINDRGQILGSVYDVSGLRAIVWPGASGVEQQAPQEGWLYDINDHGQIVGRLGSRATLWNGTEATTLPRLHDDFLSFSSTARAINNEGRIVGTEVSRPMVWDPDKSFWLPTPGGTGQAMSVNDWGTPAGYAVTRDGQRFLPLYWIEGNRWVELETFGRDGMARDINNKGQIVGELNTDFAARRAMLWDMTGETTDLNIFATGTGWDLIEATAINDDGWIVGASQSGFLDHGFLLIPTIPEPGTSSLYGGGLLAIGLAARVRHRTQRRENWANAGPHARTLQHSLLP